MPRIALYFALLIALVSFASCGGSGNKGHKGLYPYDYCFINPAMDGGEIQAYSERTLIAVDYDTNQDIEKKVKTKLTVTQKSELDNLVAAAGFDFSDNLTFGTQNPSLTLHAVFVNTEDKGQKVVYFWGETPSGATAEYLALRDYLRDLYDATISQ